MELQHGCRTEYGPLVLQIQRSDDEENRFIVYVEDPRLPDSVVHEHEALSTLESAKESAVLRAKEYLNSSSEPHEYKADWRCS
jgi:hypothetical protein